MKELVLPESTGPLPPRPRAVPAEEYQFVGPAGELGLTDLFDGHRRLAVHHMMPDRSRPGAAVAADELTAVLHAADTRLVLASHVPYAKLEQYGRHFGFDLPAYSAAGTRFGSDFPATRYLDGTGCEERDDAPGLSFFHLDGRFVFYLGSVAVPYLDFLGLIGVTRDPPPGGCELAR